MRYSLKSHQGRLVDAAILTCLMTGLFFSEVAGRADTGSRRPEAVSPGELDRIVEMRDGCFGYSWSAVEGASGFDLVVHRLSESASDPSAVLEPALQLRLPATFSWTPSLEKCLPPGRYAWAVRAQTAAGWSEWSEPRVFAVRRPRAAPRESPSTARPVAPARLASPTSVDGRSLAVAESRPPAAERLFRPDSDRPRPLFDAAFAPPSCDRGSFSDVPPSDPYCAWIEQLVRDEIVLPCESGPGSQRYCPDQPVTRRQIAMLLERAMRGTDRWRPEQGDGALPNLPPAPADPHTLLSPTHSNDVGKYTSITVGADGLGLISYYDAAYHYLKVAHCSNTNCTEAAIPFINFDTDSGQHSSIAIGVDGLGLMSYYDNTVDDLAVLHCKNVECSTFEGAYLDTAGDLGQYSSIAIGSDGLAIISYFDATSLALRVAHCADVRCSTADAITPIVHSTTFGGQYNSIAIGYDGLALISYYDILNQSVWVAHCTNVACTSAASAFVAYADPAQTAIAIGADGLGLITYRVGGSVYVAHCTNTPCTLSTVTPLDNGAEGQHSSITIGADGFGLISYYDATNQALKVAHCNNTACTSATINQVEGGGVGQYNSITIGSDGLGLISYYDAAHGSLRVAHCSNVLCAPYFRRR